MAARSGEEMAVTLLRALPPEVAEQVLAKLDAAAAAQLRAGLPATPSPPAPDALDPALAEFFDLLRIADRARALTPVELTPAPDSPQSANARGKKAGSPPRPGVPPSPPPPPDPVDDLRELPPEKLLKVLEGEPPAATALVLTVLDTATAGAVMKGLPAELRAQVAVRFSQPGSRNYPLIQKLSRAIVDKGRRLAEQPAETPPDTRIADLAGMLRSLPRAERAAVFQSMKQTDPELTDRVREKLFKFADIAKVDDRPLQGMLQQLNLKVIATALKGADDAVTGKVTANLSGRARELLQEEMSLLGAVSAAQVEDARKEILQLLLKAEEEGTISIEG
jgi:flagellar motor switch protein FliG